VALQRQQAVSLGPHDICCVAACDCVAALMTVFGSCLHVHTVQRMQ
jgi:hypothetical protein